MTSGSTKFRLDVAGATDVGRRRTVNEDAFCLDDDLQLYMVADGMGGHRAGEIASSMALDTVRDFLQTPLSEEYPEIESHGDQTLSAPANQLLDGIRVANRGMHEVASQKPSYEGMGTTLSAILFSTDGVVVANVGDSPIYLIHHKQIQQLSVPHTVLAEHAALYPNGENQLDETYGHMLTRAIGVEADVRPAISEIPCFQGDALVIGSDGLTQKVTPTEIMDITLGHKSPQACQILIDLANQRGGEDNITVVMAKVKGLRRTNGRIGSFWRSFKKHLFPTTDLKTGER